MIRGLSNSSISDNLAMHDVQSHLSIAGLLKCDFLHRRIASDKILTDRIMSSCPSPTASFFAQDYVASAFIYLFIYLSNITLTVFSTNDDGSPASSEVWKRAHGYIVVAFWQINTRET